MKYSFLILIVLSASMAAFAQPALQAFNKERYQINQTGFLVLGSWSALNMVTGIVGQAAAGGQAKYFHQMNLIWGAVNMGFALPGYLGARKSNASQGFAASVKGQAATEKTFIFNAGLDMAYIAGSAWFFQKANNSSDPDKYNKYKGYGKSILMQGVFLLLFDATMFSTHNRHGKKLFKALNGLQLAPNSIGVNMPL